MWRLGQRVLIRQPTVPEKAWWKGIVSRRAFATFARQHFETRAFLKALDDKQAKALLPKMEEEDDYAIVRQLLEKQITDPKATSLLCDMFDALSDSFRRNFVNVYINPSKQPSHDYFPKKVLRDHENGFEWLIDFREEAIEALSTTKSKYPTKTKKNFNASDVDASVKRAIFGLVGQAATSLVEIHPSDHKDLLEEFGPKDMAHPVESMSKRCGPNNKMYVIASPILGLERPLVFVAVDFSNEIPQKISSIVSSDKTTVVKTDPIENPTVATFWSINLLEPGLASMDLPLHLINKCKAFLQNERPSLNTFVTLSPMPMLKSYIDRLAEKTFCEIVPESDRNALVDYLGADKNRTQILVLRDALKKNIFEDPGLEKVIKPIILACAKDHISSEPRNQNFHCKVSQFHLGNGAKFKRFNWDADRSENRLESSFGMMVNYVYSSPEPVEVSEQKVEE